jgi:hypothetical protein
MLPNEEDEVVDIIDAQVAGESLQPPPENKVGWQALEALLLASDEHGTWVCLEQVMSMFENTRHERLVQRFGKRLRRGRKRGPFNVQEYLRDSLRMNASIGLVSIRFAKEVPVDLPRAPRHKERVYRLTYVGRKMVTEYLARKAELDVG